MSEFVEEVAEMLKELERDGDEYYSESLFEYHNEQLEHVETKFIDTRRWSILMLDVYRRKSDGALAGVLWDDPATELQEGQDRNPRAVKVKAFVKTVYKVVQ